MCAGAVAAEDLAEHRHGQHGTAAAARQLVRLCQVGGLPDLGPAEVRNAARGLTARELDEAPRHVAHVDRLEGDARGHEQRAQPALTGEDLGDQIVELGGAQHSPGQPGRLEHPFRRYRFVIRGATYYDDEYRRGADGRWRIAATGYERTYETMMSMDDLPSLRLIANRWAPPAEEHS